VLIRLASGVAPVRECMAGYVHEEGIREMALPKTRANRTPMDEPVERRPLLRILVADDHATVREGLKALLNTESDMEVVAEAGDGASALAQSRTVRPDIVVMDLSMPGMNGLEATAALSECCPEVKVLAVSRHRGRSYVQQLLRAGASGYVLKQSSAEEILRAVRAIAHGATYVDGAVSEDLFASLGSGPQRPGGTTESGVSEREEEVLRLVAWGYTNKEIAARLDLSVKTVESHKMNASAKLGLNSRVDVVRLALLRGWLREG
jgi:DNA-binding NarL/FixJ family response regulator